MATVNPSRTKRDELLEIGSRLFYEQGYHRTGVKQIIDEAGIAKGTFYSHFKSKEDLGVAWLKVRHRVWNGWLSEFISKRNGTAATRLLAMFEFLENWMVSCEYRGCAFLNTLAEIPETDHPLRAEVKNHKEELLAIIRGLVATHFPGKIEEDLTRIARVIYILFEGALIEMQNFQDVWPAQAARAQVAIILE